MVEKRQQRRRAVLACTNCKRRKLKCDHQLPCSSCRNTKRAIPECTYEVIDDKSATDQQSLQSGVSLNTSPGSNPQNYLLAAVNQAATSTNPIVSPTSQERYSSSSATDPSVTSKSSRWDKPASAKQPQTNESLVDLLDFIHMKEFKGSRVFFGPTSWKTCIMYWCKTIPVMSDILAITVREMMSLKLPEKEGEQADTSPTYHIASLLPDYEESIVLLKSFNRDTFFTKCFNHDTIARYVHEVVTPSGPNLQAPSANLSIVLSIKALVSFFNGQVPDTRLLVASRLFLFKTDLKSNFATLTALLLLYECRKYDCNIDFEEAVSYDQSLFSTIITLGLSLGLHRNISQLHLEDPLNMAAIQHTWKFLMLEDSLRSFQRGLQPMINDNYTANRMLHLVKTRCTSSILTFRKVNDEINLCVASESVDLDSALSSIEMLMFETPPTDHDDMHLQLFLYTYAQTITTIRYLKNKSGKNRYAAFRYSLLLYKLLKEMLFDLIDSSGRIMPSLFYQEIKESIFRATFFLLVLVLQLFDNVEKVAGHLPYQEVLLSRIDASTDVFWLMYTVTHEVLATILKMTNVSLTARAMIIFINHILTYVMGEIEQRAAPAQLTPDSFNFSPVSLPDLDLDLFQNDNWGLF